MTIRSAPGPARDPFEAIDAAPGDRPFVVAQLGQSLDGRIATPTGASRDINGTCALDHLHRLRAHVDAVIVGVGTVIADNPMLTVRRVPGRNPTRVFIDPHGRLPDDGAMRSLCLRPPHCHSGNRLRHSGPASRRSSSKPATG